MLIQDPKTVGSNIAGRISEIQKLKNISREQISNSMSRSVPSLNKLLHDLRDGKIGLENLVSLANALEEPLLELFKDPPVMAKEEYAMFIPRLLNTTNSMKTGQKFELKEILTGLWPALLHPEKQEFGRRFFRDVNSGIFPRVKYVRKKPNNHAEYVII
ncbi:MAG: DUF1413 domain-containing protein [Desulfosporosinus sp.]|nr:DUF1413 domain-containing protein [Desulfosporosinus sp.]